MFINKVLLLLLKNTVGWLLYFYRPECRDTSGPSYGPER